MLRRMLIMATLVAYLRSNGENPHESGAGRGKVRADAGYRQVKAALSLFRG